MAMFAVQKTVDMTENPLFLARTGIKKPFVQFRKHFKNRSVTSSLTLRFGHMPVARGLQVGRPHVGRDVFARLEGEKRKTIFAEKTFFA